jgi:proliferating cell nuclear antigen
MFEARFASATLLKRILDAIKDLVQDVNLLCTEDGIELQSMDAAHVALINFTILAEACSLYTCDEQVTLGINVVNLTKIIKCAEPEDSVVLALSEDESALHITFESRSGSRKHEFAMNLMNIDSQHLQIPEIEYTCSIKMPSAEFTRFIRDGATFGETVTLSVKEDVLVAEIRGDAGITTITEKQDKTSKSASQWTEIECGTPVSMMFALKYLAAFTKAQHISDQVALYLVAGSPLYVSYDMEAKGSVGFYLAPKHDE